MLTVGKLEPFKPEEAKRVRADGYIVKPFEASELLSALTKLEDKIVPRTESSKPGRFARATSDEPRYDKTMAAEEDAGWKNRISFPSKKKAKEVEADEPAAFEASSKDVRSVIEQMPVVAPSVKTTEERFDLGALAPEGLPKDVTPEEIAALAAAAARVKGKFSEDKPAESAPELAVIASTEVQSSSHEAPPPAIEPAPTPEVVAVAPVVATEPPAEPPQTEPKVAVGSGEVEAAIATLGTDSATQAASSGNGSSYETSSAPYAEPVTMAVGTTGDSSTPASRWAAVAVALAPEEAAMSLEQEMQKAYAAYAGAESGHSGTASMVAVADASATLSSLSTTPESSISVPATVAPEAAQTLSAVASAATEAVSAAVAELENVASSHAEQAASPVPPSEELTQPAASPVPEVATSEPAAPQVSSEAPAASTESVQSESTAAAEFKTASDAVAIEESKSAPAQGEVVSPGNTTEGAAQAASELPVAADAGHKESEAAPISAAAADTQSQGHESGNGHAPLAASPSATESTPPPDTAAMAAAVGATKAIEDVEAAVDSDPSIASIVDSVLAGLRPQIVEEISRKLGRKK